MIAELVPTNPEGQAPNPGADFQTDIANMPAKLCSLPPLDSIATRVIALADDPDCDLKRLASAAEADPAFAAEVLFLANSPLFGLQSKLQVLHRAIAVLGLDRVKSMAMTVAMRAFVGQGGPLIRQCWRHSAACAVIAEFIAPAFGASGDQAYSAALMHDIGRLGLVKSYGQEIGPVMEKEHAALCDVLVEERAAINVDHQNAGAWLIRHWALPEPFVEICEHHHDPLDPGDSALLQAIKVACRTADALGYSAVRYQPVSYQEIVAGLPEGVRQDRIPSEENLRDRVKERLASFEQ